MTHPPQPPEPDIVERLRDLHMQFDGRSLYAVAADEIERLRAAISERAPERAQPVRWLVGLPDEPLDEHAAWVNEPTAHDLRQSCIGSGLPQDSFIVTPLYTHPAPERVAPDALGATPTGPGSSGSALGPSAARPSGSIPSAWVPMHERAPDPDTECVVMLRYSLDRPPFLGLDTWAAQREDPIGMGGPTIETGYGWNDNFEADVIAWIAIPPKPPAEWDQRLPDAARGIEREARESEGPSPKGEEPGPAGTRPNESKEQPR